MQLAKLCILLFICTATLCNGQQMQFNPHLCPPVEIPASTNVTDLTELTFWGRIADGRVWLVEFYADFCRGCKRIAGHVSMLADALAETHPDIAVGRINCEHEAEFFCAHVIKISRTPSFKVYYQGKKAMDYNVDFFFFDTAQAFITDIAANLKGFSLPSSKPQERRTKGRAGDDYDDDDADDDYE